MAENGEITGNMAIPGHILEQARTWYVRVGSEQAGTDDWRAFTNWLEADPVHIDAYDRVELALADIPNQNVNLAPSPHIPDNVVSLQKKRRVLKSAPLSYLAGIAATLIAALVLLNSTNIFNPAPVQIQYATNIGEYENIVLTDGTRINLNTNTRLGVSMGKKTRAVTLYSGEAYFDIAADQKRSFVINAGDTRITDIGTAFSVHLSDNSLSVAVSEGIVDMQSPVQKIRLTKGQKAVQPGAAETFTIATVDIANISTWRDGVLVFENAPLSTIVPELNRYFKTPIILVDEKTSALTFSGVLNISDQDKMIHSIEALLPVKAKVKGKQILLSNKP